MTVRRDWRDAVAHHEGHGCRVCLQFPRQLAHVLPRTFDRQRGRMQGTIRVHPLAVVPLCRHHHERYDADRLNLEAHLTDDELAHAISIVGEGDALTRIRGVGEAAH